VAIVRGAIAIAVCVTAAGLLAETPLAAWRAQRVRVSAAGDRTVATIAVGVVLGALVTLTSVGAGALGAVALLQLYPSRLTPPRLVATDIAHAIPLALVAGVGHLSLSNVDGTLLRDLLAGSIPGALAGALISSRVSHTAIRVLLGVVLLVVGITMLL
jgi:hypothetical protein